MPELTSTIGKVGRASPPVAPKTDSQATETVASIPQAIQPALDPMGEAGPPAEQKQPMPVPTLRSLIELGKVQESIMVGGLEFQMETLNDDAQENLFKKLAKLDSEGADSFINLRRIVVAMSVVSVGGQPFGDFDPSSVPVDPSALESKLLDRKISTARRMQSQVIDKLYDFYNSLLEKSRKEIDPESVKK